MSIQDTAWHNLAGNDAPAVQVGFTRGIVAAGLMSVANTLLVFSPIDDAAKVTLMATMNPALILASYLVYSYLEPWFKRHVSDDDDGGDGGGDA